jgi:hypothetical protein
MVLEAWPLSEEATLDALERIFQRVSVAEVPLLVNRTCIAKIMDQPLHALLQAKKASDRKEKKASLVKEALVIVRSRTDYGFRNSFRLLAWWLRTYGGRDPATYEKVSRIGNRRVSGFFNRVLAFYLQRHGNIRAMEEAFWNDLIAAADPAFRPSGIA